MSKKTFKSSWDSLEKKLPYPKRARKICITDYNEFKQKVLSDDPNFIEEITSSIFSGDIYILKGGYTKEFMENLKIKTFSYFKNKPSEFHKMLEGCPDFHRKIDLEAHQYDAYIPSAPLHPHPQSRKHIDYVPDLSNPIL